MLVEYLIVNFLPFFFDLPKRQLIHNKIKVKDLKYLQDIIILEIQIYR